jgi:hypothetical protein
VSIKKVARRTGLSRNTIPWRCDRMRRRRTAGRRRGRARQRSSPPRTRAVSGWRDTPTLDGHQVDFPIDLLQIVELLPAGIANRVREATGEDQGRQAPLRLGISVDGVLHVIAAIDWELLGHQGASLASGRVHRLRR